MRHGQRYPFPPQKTIAVDVDDTLHHGYILNGSVVDWCERRKAEGFELLLWSARGREYAEKVAEGLGVAGLFDAIVSKPGYVLDDQGWNWIKYTVVVRTLKD